MLHISIYICHIRICTYGTYIYIHICHISDIYDIHPKHMLPLCVYIQAQKASFIPTQTMIWEENWASELGVHIQAHSCNMCTYTKVTYIHRRKLLSLSSYVIYVHVHASVTYMHFYICHLYICPYVKDTDMRVYVCYTYMVCIDALMHIWHMYMCVCTCVTYMHIYICYLHTCNICYLNTYPTYIHMWAICR